MASDSAPPDIPSQQQMCVICGKRPQVETYRPFCSKRCADIDLGRWFSGSYAIASAPNENEDELPNDSDISEPEPSR